VTWKLDAEIYDGEALHCSEFQSLTSPKLLSNPASSWLLCWENWRQEPREDRRGRQRPRRQERQSTTQAQPSTSYVAHSQRLQMGWEYRIPSLPIPWPKMSPQNCTVSSCSAWSGCKPGFLYPHVVSEIRIVFPLVPLTPKHFVVPSRLMSVYSNG